MDKKIWIATVETSGPASDWLRCDHPHLHVKDGVCQSCGERVEAAPIDEKVGASAPRQAFNVFEGLPGGRSHPAR